MTIIMNRKKRFTQKLNINMNVHDMSGTPYRGPIRETYPRHNTSQARRRTQSVPCTTPTCTRPPVCLALTLGLALVCALHLALGDPDPSKQQHALQVHHHHHQQQQQQQPPPGGPLQQRAVLPAAVKRRPDSSSSFLAEVEDLSDSSIHTRLGRITIEHLGDSPHDFDRLIERIVPEEALKTTHQIVLPIDLQQTTGKFHAPADPNNKTSMRFFRNSKTFASIVYTNPVQDGQQQPRRLINCHLVDLEKHSSDVVIYEAKYDIRTIDVEFRDMMQLIEACTNIARLRRRPVASNAKVANQKSDGTGQQQVVSGSQIFAPPAGPEGGLATSNNRGSSGSENKPKVVVGRPLVHLTPSSSHIKSNNQQQQQQLHPSSLTQFNQVMSGALDRELKQLGPMVDDSNRLDLPSSVTFTEMHNHPTGFESGEQKRNERDEMSKRAHKRQHFHHKRQQHDHSGQRQRRRRQQRAHAPDERQVGRFEPWPSVFAEHELPRSETNDTVGSESSPLESLDKLVSSIEKYQAALKNFKRQLASHPLVKTINRVSEVSKKLVLGEVTAPPDASTKYGRNSPGGGSTRASVREAIQEISSYDTSDLLSIWRGILPGTNWCGMGDRATSYNDLGFESDIDICCRAHDFCPIRLSAFSSGYGLFNWSFYTRSHCWCDQNFLDCLQQAESPLSNVVMKFYFTIMKTTCLNDNETSNALLEHGSDSSLKHNLGSSQQQRYRSSSRGAIGSGGGGGGGGNGDGLLKVIEQQAAALLGNSNNQAPVPHMGIPALAHSQAFQNRYDRQQQQQQQQQLAQKQQYERQQRQLVR